MTATQTAADTIYTEVSGCTFYVDGQIGTTVGFHYTMNRITGAFVRLDGGPMVLVETSIAPSGDRGQHREVLSHRVIDRDEFDRLNGITQLRAELGWK